MRLVMTSNHGRKGGLCAEGLTHHGRKGGLCAEGCTGIPQGVHRVRCTGIPQVYIGWYIPGRYASLCTWWCIYPGGMPPYVPWWYIPGYICLPRYPGVYIASLPCLPTIPPWVHPVHTRPTHYWVHCSTAVGVRGGKALGSRGENALGGSLSGP